jgi:riboflavin kinase/FMN adenylyltransferase
MTGGHIYPLRGFDGTRLPLYQRGVIVYRNLADVGQALRGAHLALGNFDGVHLGHQALLASARSHAQASGARSAALTFDPPPSRVLAGRATPQLSPLSARLDRMALAGLDAVIVQTFDLAFAAWSPADFEAALFDLGLGGLVVGYDFTYARARAGTVDTLSAAGKARGVPVTVIPPVLDEGVPVSSSRIRKLLLAGDVAGAARLLGRPYELSGTVVHGMARGRTIGFPTANLETAYELVPETGVYAAVATVGGKTWPAAVNIGRKPTVNAGAEPATIEAHLIGLAGDLYGQPLSLGFLERLRGEQKFDGLAALKQQIALDVERAQVVGREALGRG